MADQLISFKKEVDSLVAKGEKKDVAILTILKRYIKESKAIRFEGNGYSLEWEKEAAKRGLANIKTTPKALDAYVSKKTSDLFTRNNIFNSVEIHARHEIMLENYMKKLQIESRIIGELVTSSIIPASVSYQNTLIENVKGLKEIGLTKAAYEPQFEILKKISEHMSIIKKSVDEMTEERKKANTIADSRKLAIAYDEKVKPFFETIRYNVDKLELIVGDEYWPLPKFRELLFLK
jgi:glutamine synthetase